MPETHRLEIFAIVGLFAFALAFVSETHFTTVDCFIDHLTGRGSTFCEAKLRDALTFYTPPPKDDLVRIKLNDKAALAGAREEYISDYLRSSALEPSDTSDEDADDGAGPSKPAKTGEKAVSARAEGTTNPDLPYNIVTAPAEAFAH